MRFTRSITTCTKYPDVSTSPPDAKKPGEGANDAFGAIRGQHISVIAGTGIAGVSKSLPPDQCEYATDIVFRRQADLQAIYENLARTAIHTVKPDNIATFLARMRLRGVNGKRWYSERWRLFPGDVAYVWHGALHVLIASAKRRRGTGLGYRLQSKERT